MQENLEIYQIIFENNSYPMWIFDQETLQFLSVNQAAINLYGYSREEFLSMVLTDINLKEKTKNLNYDDQQINSKQNFFHRKKNGDVAIVELGSFSLLANGRKVVSNSINDITELTKIQDALRESEESYRSLVENSEDMTMRFDREYKHLYANPVTEKFLNIKPEDFIGKNHQELGFDKEQYEYWDKKIEEVFLTGKKTREVSEINAGEFIFHWDLVPEFDKEGKVASVLSVTRDMTDIAKSRKALEESEAKLRESNVTKDKLFSIIAHDLRGPVGNIERVLDLIENDEDLDASEKKYFLAELHKVSKTVNELLNNLLIWANSQLGGLDIKRDYFPILVLVQRNINLMESTAHQKNITLLMDVEQSLMAFADVESINVVVRNLIANAIKFTQNGGTISVTAIDCGSHIEIKVADDGIGMTAEVIDKLFEQNSFYTSLGTNNERGSGLGLMLCKEFVTHNKGTINVSSVLGKGSEFVFTLPKIHDEEL